MPSPFGCRTSLMISSVITIPESKCSNSKSSTKILTSSGEGILKLSSMLCTASSSHDDISLTGGQYTAGCGVTDGIVSVYANRSSMVSSSETGE